jgi:hypothetical protein
MIWVGYGWSFGYDDGETWRVSSKVSGRLCGNLWSCANPRSYVPINEVILGWEIRLHSHSK